MKRLLSLVIAFSATAASIAQVNGVQHQLVTIDFAGPTSSEGASNPNPFLDYRLQVRFTHVASGKVYNVPGFFDGDGTGGGSGNVWRVRFTPDLAGDWNYQADLRAGVQVAVELSASAGSPVSLADSSGVLEVAPRDPSAPGFLKWGRLDYVGGHYLKFRDGPYWVKTGADDPEDFFGYPGFDDVSTSGKHHTFAPHANDDLPDDADGLSGADATWATGRGRNLLGAMNYLASTGVNSLYIILMNIGGDGQNTHPYLTPINVGGSSTNDNLHFDISRLRQWNIAMMHAQKRGLNLQFVLNEAEERNKKELDNATLGVERKLFYRELIARFGHLQAFQWNLCEEYDYKFPIPANTIKLFAGYIQDVDPYDHPITVHQQGNPDSTWAPFVGDSRFSLTSFQYPSSPAGFGAEVEEWRQRTANAGRKIPIMMDELHYISTTNMKTRRKSLLWPTLMSGGGIEFYIGSSAATLNDMRLYNDIWVWSGHARRFFEENLPYWEMEPMDGLLTGETTTSGAGNGQVLAKAGEVYALSWPNSKVTGNINLSGASGTFTKRWFNPESGNFEGPVTTIEGGGTRAVGAPPSRVGEDWVLLISKQATSPQISSLTLINADTEQPIAGYDPIANGAQINLALLPTRNLNVRANVANALVQSVRFGWNGNSSYSVQSSAPFALAGQTNGDYHGVTFSTGAQSITAVPYSAANAGGEAGNVYSLSFNVIDQPPPDPVYYELSVALALVGSGSGSVSGPGISCGSDCSEMILENTSVSLVANAAAGSRFMGWSGACSGTGGCSFAMSAARSVTAQFAATYNLSVTKSGTGSGTVSGPGINCGSDCGEAVVEGSQVTLAAAPASGSIFAGWSGACSGTGSCVVTMSEAQSVNAQFTQDTSVPSVGITGLTLINADSNQPIAGYNPIPNGAVISLGSMPTRNFNIRANPASSQVKSVRFKWNSNNNYRTESEAPFAMAGDTDGDYKAVTFSTGTHTFGATPYPQTSAGGTAGPTHTITITVTN